VNHTATANGPAAEAKPKPSPRTQWPEIFGMLALPFREEHIKTKTIANRQMRYVTARTVMNRLDFALGPENWWDKYQADEHSVVCELTIRLPDGQILTKSDAGGYAGMSDPGDDDKSGYSDAFKRAAVKFGVGRHLYNDGVVSYPKDVPPPTNQSEPLPEPRPNPEHLNCRGWIQNRIDETNADWAALCGKYRKDYKPLCGNGKSKESALWQCINGIVTTWLESDPPALYPDAVETDGRRDKAKVALVLRDMWESEDQGALKVAVETYLGLKLESAAREAGINLDSEPAETSKEN
jgi:hypothetical protein